MQALCHKRDSLGGGRCDKRGGGAGGGHSMGIFTTLNTITLSYFHMFSP